MSVNVLAIVQPANCVHDDVPYYLAKWFSLVYSVNVPGSKWFFVGFEYIKPLSLYRLCGSNFMVPKLFLPFVSVPTPANNWPFKFQLVLHNVANSIQNSATIIYFGFIFKVNTQILYSQRKYVYMLSMSTFCSNKMCTTSSNVIEADVNSSAKDSRDTSLSVNGSLLLYSVRISI